MIFILTHEYSDKSGFKVCGITENPVVADAWRKADNSMQTKVYVGTLDKISESGLPEWDYK
jgi:hypothetical protein